MKKSEKIVDALQELEDKRKEINSKLEGAYVELLPKENFKFKCSDHAVVRYLQRIEFIPVSEARYKILKEIENAIKEKNIQVDFLKNVVYSLYINGKQYLIKNSNIITVIVDE